MCQDSLDSNPNECNVTSDFCSESKCTKSTCSASDADSTLDTESDLVVLDESHSQQFREKSVRFSFVQTREYNVVEELAPPGNDREEVVRRSLGWEYVERKCDVETHMELARTERKERYLRMIQRHIQRAERAREERENEVQYFKKRGFKSRVIQPLWKGFLSAANRSSLVMPSPYG